MKNVFRFIVTLLVLGTSMLACSSSFQVVETPVVILDPINNAADLLPHSLYYVAAAGVNGSQLFRMARDGKTLMQLTNEPAMVYDYDVSSRDGSVVYVANNQLILIQADGSNRRVLVDGGSVDPNNPVETNLHDPVFSPDGGKIAYAYQGVNLFDLSTGLSSLILQDVNYRPQTFSPDGTKILMTVNVPNSDGTHDVLYFPASNSTVGFTSTDGSFFCCGREEWSQDGNSLYVANPAMGILTSGLWRVDAASGVITTLLPTDAGNGKFNLADEPYLASDGQLYYFYLNGTDLEGFSDAAPLQIVRSAPDGVTGRTVLRPETFESLAEALWAPDGSFVIAAKRSNNDGVLELYYTDAAKGMISLLASGGAQSMKWGP